MDSPEQIAISLNSSVVLLPVAMKGGAYKLLVLFKLQSFEEKLQSSFSFFRTPNKAINPYNRKPRPSELDEKLK
jgi:hypothetical protein